MRELRLAEVKSCTVRWISAAVKWGLIATFLVALPVLIIAGAFPRADFFSLLYSSAIYCILAASAFLGLYIFMAVFTNSNGIPQTWQCVIDDRGWSVSDERGYSYFIPWELMRQLIEHPEGWHILVEHTKVQIWVFRQPLRAAGLEEEFRSRMGRKPANAADEA